MSTPVKPPTGGEGTGLNFTVLDEAAPASQWSQEVQSILANSPAGPTTITSQAYQDLRVALQAGQVLHHRLADLHRLLSGRHGPQAAHVVDNGPGVLAWGSLTLAQLGSRVSVKEPRIDARQMMFGSVQHYSSELAPFISAAELADVTPARVVYWTDPFGIYDKPDEQGLFEYLARDVERGGFLVIQTDHILLGPNNDIMPNIITGPFLEMKFDDTKWDVIFKDWISKYAPDEDFVLPTYISGSHFLQIYRRREKGTRTLSHHRSESGRHAVSRFLEGARRRQASDFAVENMPVTAMTVGANLAAIESAVLGI